MSAGSAANGGEPGPGTAAHFRRVLGEAAVQTGAAAKRFACAGMMPACVVQPRAIEEVGAAVRAAREANYTLVPSGNATHLDIGSPPRRYDAALSVRRLDRILAHDAGDMTVTAEAGVTLSALNDALGDARQWLPLDPPRSNQVTLGGLIAADRNGPLRLAHGKVRDLLIGLKVVMADGAVVRGGGRVVKNVAGYDLPKLLTGSFGTLGIIVEATFKLRPRPAHERVFVWPASTIEEAVACALGVLDSPVTPVLLEGVNQPAAEAIGLRAKAALLVGCAGSEAEVDAQATRLAEMAAGRLVLPDESAAAALLEAVRAFPQPSAAEAILARLSTLPTELGSLLKRIEAEAAARRLAVELCAHAGSGVAWCRVAAADPAAMGLFAEWMRVTGCERNGWVVFEALPAALRGRVDPWGFSEPTVPLMAGIKKAFDPDGVFSPGRFVAGI